MYEDILGGCCNKHYHKDFNTKKKHFISLDDNEKHFISLDDNDDDHTLKFLKNNIDFILFYN
jgi:hypothetical protein